MLVAVIGGNLQGVEAAYLAHKAGWEVMVIDKKPIVPASGLCDSFVNMDVACKEDLNRLLKGIDLVIPALEDDRALMSLGRWAIEAGLPFAFDPQAYSVSSSKVKSNRLFERINIPAPRPWPECSFPVIAKPSTGSGSRRIQIFDNLNELKNIPKSLPSEEWVVQEFVRGHVYSVEVIGSPKHYRAIQVTDLIMDVHYDCKRVLAPTELSPERIAELEELSVAIAEALELHGMMDVEVILNNGVLKVLEVDARLPSQTPTSVYWSTGLNMVQILGNLFLKSYETNPMETRSITPSPLGVVYEHIRIASDMLEIAGEHIMSVPNALFVIQDFFGVDEAITNYTPNRDEWVATLIITGNDRQEAWARRGQVIKDIQRCFDLSMYYDPEPLL